MAYKAGFKPMERLGRDGWRPMETGHGREPVSVALPSRSRKVLLDA